MLSLAQLAMASCALMMPASASESAAARCGTAALAQAARLLRFQADLSTDAPVDIEQASLRELGSVPALSSRVRYNVLEVWGSVYKAHYRLRLLYVSGNECALVGQEILEKAKP